MRPVNYRRCTSFAVLSLEALCSLILSVGVMAPIAAGDIVVDEQFSAATGPPSTIPISLPGPGTLTVRLLNPDASPGAWLDLILSSGPRDGQNDIARLAGLASGYTAAGDAYRGDYSTGAIERDFKFSIAQGASNGLLSLVDYLPSSLGPTGTDELIVDYSSQPLAVPDSAPLLSITSGPLDMNSVSGSFVAPTAGYVMVHNTSTGEHGGGFGIYLDGSGIGSTLEIPPVPAFYLADIPAGAHTVTLTHQDDLFGDNTGTRSADVYFVASVPEPTSVALAIFAIPAVLTCGARYKVRRAAQACR